MQGWDGAATCSSVDPSVWVSAGAVGDFVPQLGPLAVSTDFSDKVLVGKNMTHIDKGTWRFLYFLLSEISNLF